MDHELSDDAILAGLGHRLARHRLERSLTQADLAEQAGVSKRTVERIEAGESVQLGILIRILRGLDLLAALDQAIPEPATNPLDLLKLKGKQRQRASSSRQPVDTDEPWTWGDDE